jgi:hypothetical protein
VTVSIFMPYISTLAGACRITRKVSLRGIRVTDFNPFVPRRRKPYFDGCKLITNIPVRDLHNAKGCASNSFNTNFFAQEKRRTSAQPFSIHCDDYLVFSGLGFGRSLNQLDQCHRCGIARTRPHFQDAQVPTRPFFKTRAKVRK